METIEFMSGRISFAQEMKELLELSNQFAANDIEKYRYNVLIKHCEEAIKTEEQFINTKLELMESECL